MLYLLVEIENNLVVSAHSFDDADEQEAVFINILLDYGMVITDDILEKRYIEIDDGLILQLVEVDDEQKLTYN